jgi:MFS transporter, ACS family, glucarate transporter
MEGRRVRVKYQHRVLGLLSLLSIITYIDRVCIGVAGPRMQDALHISPQAWGWVASVFFLSYSAFEIPTGALGDRIGPRRVLTRIVLWWSAFTSLTGAVSSYSLLLVVRFCFGMGEAGAYPNAAAVIGRWIPPLQRTRAWGIVWMTGQIGAAISPLLVLPIQARYGWRASFFLFGFLGVIWAAVWYAWFRDSPLEKAGITPGELEEIGPPLVVRHGGLPWSRTLRQPTFWTFATIGASYVYTLGFFQAWLQTYLVRGHGYSDAALALSSLTYVLGACANVTGGFVGDWLVRRFGLTKGRRTLGAFGLSTAAFFMLATVVAPNGTWALAFLSIAYGGILLQQPNLCAVSLDIGRQHAGAVFGFMNTAANLASAVSSVLFGYIVAATGSYDAPLIPMAAALFIGTWLWFRIDPTQQLFEEEMKPAA